MKKIALMMIILAVAGCANVSRTSLNEQLGYTEELAGKYTADSDWWKAYNDPELDRLINMALENNSDLAISGVNITKALYTARNAGVDLYPSLSGSLGASINKDLVDGVSRKSFSGELGLSYELDFLGKNWLAASGKKLEYDATLLDYESARLTLINSVVDVYYNMAYLLKAKDVAESNLDNYKRLYEIADAKYDTGKADNASRIQVQQSLISAENTLLDLNNQIRSMEQSLRNLLNIGPADELAVNYADISVVTPLEPNIDVPLEVLAARPDLKAAELRLEQAFKSTQIQNRSWYPSISLKAALSSSSSDIKDTFSFPVLGGSVSISLPFLQWNTVKNNIKISEADYEASRIGFESSINTALNELAYYYYAYGITKSTYENTQKKHSTDTQLVDIYMARYDTGKIELADLLTAMNTENNSSRDVLNNSYQLIKYENMIYKAMAGRYY